MGCLSSVNLSISKDKKDFNNKPLNKTELPNDSYEEHSCKINEDNENNKIDNVNINNIPFDILKSYQYYYNNKNYKSCEIGKNKKITLIQLNTKNSNNNNEIKDEIKDEIKNINDIEDMDIDINLYKKYIVKDENKKKEEQIKEIKNNNNTISEEMDEISNNINNGEPKADIKKNESKMLRKSIEERITKFNVNKNQEKNKEFDDSICNLGKSYIKEKEKEKEKSD